MNQATTARAAGGGARWLAIAGTLARITLTVVLGLLAGTYSGAFLFGDALAHSSFPQMVGQLALGHAVAGLLLGALGGRWWPAALVGCWGAVWIAGLYALSGVQDMGAVSAAMALVLAAGAWLGARLTRSAAPRPNRGA